MNISRHVVITLIVAVLTAALAIADTEGRRDVDENRSKVPVSGKSQDAGSASTIREDDVEAFITETPVTETSITEIPVIEIFSSSETNEPPNFLGGGRGDEDGCHGGYCLSCSCKGGCECWGSEPCDVLKKFSALGGCRDLRCEKGKENCTCTIPSRIPRRRKP